MCGAQPNVHHPVYWLDEAKFIQEVTPATPPPPEPGLWEQFLRWLDGVLDRWIESQEER